MKYAVYYRKQKMSEDKPIKELAEQEMRRLSHLFANLEVREVS